MANTNDTDTFFFLQGDDRTVHISPLLRSYVLWEGEAGGLVGRK